MITIHDDEDVERIQKESKNNLKKYLKDRSVISSNKAVNLTLNMAGLNLSNVVLLLIECESREEVIDVMLQNFRCVLRVTSMWTGDPNCILMDGYCGYAALASIYYNRPLKLSDTTSVRDFKKFLCPNKGILAVALGEARMNSIQVGMGGAPLSPECTVHAKHTAVLNHWNANPGAFLDSKTNLWLNTSHFVYYTHLLGKNRDDYNYHHAHFSTQTNDRWIELVMLVGKTAPIEGTGVEEHFTGEKKIYVGVFS